MFCGEVDDGNTVDFNGEASSGTRLWIEVFVRT